MESIEPVTHERREGPTPNGGVYSIAYFSKGEDEWIPCPKEEATRMEIHEFDENDNSFFRTYMVKETGEQKVQLGRSLQQWTEKQQAKKQAAEQP